MGKEKEIDSRFVQLEGYQINQKTLSKASPGALVMHCLPAHRDKEITEEIFEAHSETIFRQAENRLHTQKAILEWAVQNS
jgi:ornithine carbamoyltransferase